MTDRPTANRSADPRVLPQFIERWSPRAFDRTPVPDDDLKVIFEAAGWAASAYNYQPWTFLYAPRTDEALFATFLSALVPFNQSWAKDAGALIFVVSDEFMRGANGNNPNHSHSFDAGAAWAGLALQAHAMGYITHGMSGVDFDKAREVLEVPEGYRIEAAIAIGSHGPIENLPEGLREREVPSTRKPVSQIAIAGTFPKA